MSGLTVCESCAEEVDPHDPTLVRARVRLDDDEPFDAKPQALFHGHCFPIDSPIWVRR